MGPSVLSGLSLLPVCPPRLLPSAQGEGRVCKREGGPLPRSWVQILTPLQPYPPPTYALEIFLLGSSIVAWGNHQDLLYAKTGSHYPGSRVTKPV